MCSEYCWKLKEMDLCTIQYISPVATIFWKFLIPKDSTASTNCTCIFSEKVMFCTHFATNFIRRISFLIFETSLATNCIFSLFVILLLLSTIYYYRFIVWYYFYYYRFIVSRSRTLQRRRMRLMFFYGTFKLDHLDAVLNRFVSPW